MVQSITVKDDFPLKPGEVIRVKLPPSTAVEIITIGNELETSSKTTRKFAARSRVVEMGTNKPHVSTYNMEKIPRYAPMRDVYHKD